MDARHQCLDVHGDGRGVPRPESVDVRELLTTSSLRLLARALTCGEA
jgi:hypothetical protein